MSTELESQLLIVSEINYRVEKLFLEIGALAMTPERITEIVAESVMAQHAEGVRICPGWGVRMNHLWAYKQDAPPKKLGAGAGLMERCGSHPDRRTGKERRK